MSHLRGDRVHVADHQHVGASDDRGYGDLAASGANR